MNHKNYVPGPTEVRPEILEAQARPMFSHRGADMRELMHRIVPRLKKLLRTEQNVVLATSSATGFMEGCVQNLVDGGGMLVLACGSFSALWADIARANGRRVDVLEVPWGQGFTPDGITAALGKRRYDVVTITHNETSTGVMNPVPELARAIRRHSDALVVVDAVSSMAGVDIPFDQWDLDVCFAGVQKAFALPPGLTVAAISRRAIERAQENPLRGYYHDFVRYLSYMEKGETPSTPAISLLFALDLQLERIEVETMEVRAARHATMAKLCQDWARKRAKLFASERFLSPTVTCVDLTGKFDPQKLREQMKERGITLGAGYGKLKASCFRIGHMGDHTVDDIERLLATLDSVLSPSSS